MLKLKLKPHRNPQTADIEFWDGDVRLTNAVFTHQELYQVETGVMTMPAACVHDIGRLIVCRAWDMAIMRPYDTNAQGHFTPDAFRFDLDVPKLMKATRHLCGMNAALPRKPCGAPGKEMDEYTDLEQEVPLSRFQRPAPQLPLLTVAQMVKHPHVGEQKYFIQTLAAFRRSLSGDHWKRLTDVMSRYLPRAKIWGQGKEEFYFDGRKMGLGFNGGIILRGQEFSIHT